MNARFDSFGGDVISKAANQKQRIVDRIKDA